MQYGMRPKYKEIVSIYFFLNWKKGVNLVKKKGEKYF